MAKDTIGNVSVKVSADGAQFRADMQANAKRAQAFGRTMRETSSATKQATVLTGRQSSALTSLAQGASDAAAVYGTTGLGGAIRASSNNMEQFLTLMLGAKGAIAGAALAVGGTLVASFLKSADAAKKAKQETKELTEAVATFRRELDSNVRTNRLASSLDLSDVGSAEKTVGQSSTDIATTKATLEGLATREDDIRKRLQENAVRRFKLEKTIAEVRAGGPDGGRELGRGRSRAILKKLDAELEKTKAAIELDRERNKEVKKRRVLNEENLSQLQRELKIGKGRLTQLRLVDKLRSASERFGAFIKGGQEELERRKAERQRAELRAGQRAEVARLTQQRGELLAASKTNPGRLADTFQKGSVEAERELSRQGFRDVRKKEGKAQEEAVKELKTVTAKLTSIERELKKTGPSIRPANL